MSTKVLTRLGFAAGAAAAVALTLPAPPAYAAPPPNDELGSARLISQIPAKVAVDTTQATTNPATDTFDYPCMGGHSVWYRFTPTTTTTVRFTFSYLDGADFDAMIGLFHGPASNLTPVACNDDTSIGSAVQARLTAGANYFIAISTCCNTQADYGGTGALRVFQPRALRLFAPVLTSAAGDISGRALFTGTYRCTNPVAYFEIDITVRQRVGDLVARGTGGLSDACRTFKQNWSVAVDSDTSVAFRRGQASVMISRYADDGFHTVSTTTTQVMTLALEPAQSAPR
jgi:hypothetical protein